VIPPGQEDRNIGPNKTVVYPESSISDQLSASITSSTCTLQLRNLAFGLPVKGQHSSSAQNGKHKAPEAQWDEWQKQDQEV